VTLAPGTRLGPYEILAPLGAGGMGEVYRAHDTRLGRDVAIKVLPAHPASTSEVRARFEREARTVSQLNHPHICTLFDVGREGETDYLVMELLEGETLAHRLEKGALPVAEVLALGRQIAEALDRAHRAGVVHRDLKPGNVMLTKSGAKLMDFGLARAQALGPVAGALTQSPTVAQPLTAEGTIVGTFQYMAPEQLEGKDADARSDLWGLGCVLYEMATGTRAFEGGTQASLISAIMRDTPRSMAELQPVTPPALERIVRRCLAKDPDDRFQNASDLAFDLEALSTTSGGASASPRAAGAPASRKILERLMWGVAVATLAIVFVASHYARRVPVATRTTITSPPGMQISTNPCDAAISPDGKMIVFAASDSAGQWWLWLRPLESLDARPIAGTEFSRVDGPNGMPFWSPDGKSIGFFADDKLKTIPIYGGTPQLLADASDGRGGTWNRQGVILFARSSQGPLFRMPQSGGAPEQVTFLDSSRHEIAHRFPCFLPDGRHFEFVALLSQGGKFETWVGELGTRSRTLVLTATSGAVFVPPAHLVFVRDQSLMVQSFDPRRARLAGEPARIGEAPENLTTLGTNPASASENGTVVYPSSALASSRLTWFGRDGKVQGDLPVALGDYREISFSPDQRQIALLRQSSSAGNDIWIADASRGSMTRLTTDGSNKKNVLWSGDGAQIAYATVRGSEGDFYARPASGSDAERLLYGSNSAFKQLDQLTRDGAYLVFDDLGLTTNRDLWVLSLRGDRGLMPYLRTPFEESFGAISPSGRWMLYQSNQSGRWEINVQSFPVPGKKVRISTDGGSGGVWRDDGAEIWYTSPKGLMLVSVNDGQTLAAGEPRMLVPLPKGFVAAGATSDFKRFLLAVEDGDAQRTSLTVLTNWTSLLRREHP